MPLDVLMRYIPIIDFIQNSGIPQPTILEVGSGPNGITTYLKRKVVGLDLDFPVQPSPYLEPRVGSATALPFSDRSFDFVVSTDTLEHIPVEDRARALSEMCRVARLAVVCGVPCGKVTQEYERRFNEKWREVHDVTHCYLDEHEKFGLPEADEMLRLAEQLGRDHGFGRVWAIKNVNLEFWYYYRINELRTDPPILYHELREFATNNPLLFTKCNSWGDCYRHIFFLAR